MTMPIELRYHIELFDDLGNQINLNNLDRDELACFNASHENDDLDYRVIYDRVRSLNVTSGGAA